MTDVALGFSLDCLSLPAEKILPSRKVPAGFATSKKVNQVRSSIEEIGLIEPLSVTPEMRNTGKHVSLPRKSGPQPRPIMRPA